MFSNLLLYLGLGPTWCKVSYVVSYLLFLLLLALLDDLDKELNNYIMRCREWYGWHFPEVGKIITDNLAYCKSVRKIGEDLHSSATVIS